MRDTIIFAGQSNTFGLGLEWELDPELNSEEYLSKGVHLPLPPETRGKYFPYWKAHRWSGIVSKELGYKEYNIYDEENRTVIGSNGIDTFIFLVLKENLIQELLSKTKFVIFETPYIRWYDEKLHGGIDGYKYPNTVMEIIELINNPKSDDKVVREALDWIGKIDSKTFYFELYKKINYLKETYKEIEFLILPWTSGKDSITNSKNLGNSLISIIENGKEYPDVNTFLNENKLKVYHWAKAWNGDYKYNYLEEHPSIEGHKRIANIIVQHIKKLENVEKR